MIYEILSVTSTIILLIASIFLFYLQTRFTKGFMKKFVVNSTLCFFFILSERLLDTIGEFIFSINNITYHIFSIILLLGAVISFFRAISALTVIKSFIPEALKKELK